MIDQARLVQTFLDLVRIDSPSGEEEAIAQELSRRLVGLGFQVQRDAHGNVIGSEEGPAPLLLSAHMDTVEPGRGVKPVVTDDRIHTDETTVLGGDCKAGIAAILEGLESVRQAGVPRTPVQVVLTRGEEVGLTGARNLDFSLVTGAEAVVFDGGGPVSSITTGSPTYIRFEVRIIGRAAHAGVEPEKGISAIRIAAELIGALPQGRMDGETTFNVGTIAGGSVRNAVPEHATFSGEYRSRNPASLSAMESRFLEAVAETRRRHPEAVVEEERGVEFQMYSLDADDPVVERATRAIVAIGLTPTLGPSGGGTDLNIFTLHGKRGVVVGMATHNAHTVREYVEIPDLADAARFCHALLTDPQALRG